MGFTMPGDGGAELMPEPSKKLCFVIGPIGDPGTQTRTHADWLLKAVIKPVFDASFPDFVVTRAD
jgi:hypothetical protein